MSSQFKYEQKKYEKAKKSLQTIKGFIQDDLIAISLSESATEDVLNAIALVERFCDLNIGSLESHIDDLENKKGEI